MNAKVLQWCRQLLHCAVQQFSAPSAQAAELHRHPSWMIAFYTELDRPLGIRSLCVCVCVCHVVLVAAKAICPSSSEAHVGARVVCSFRSWITAPSTVLPKSYVVRRRAASPGRALQAAKPVLPPKSESG